MENTSTPLAVHTRARSRVPFTHCGVGGGGGPDEEETTPELEDTPAADVALDVALDVAPEEPDCGALVAADVPATEDDDTTAMLVPLFAVKEEDCVTLLPLPMAPEDEEDAPDVAREDPCALELPPDPRELPALDALDDEPPPVEEEDDEEEDDDDDDEPTGLVHPHSAPNTTPPTIQR